MYVRVVIVAVLVGLILAIWAVLSWTGSFSELLLPSPREVGDALVTVLGQGETYSALKTTVLEIAAAFGIAVTIALLLGVPIGWYRTLQAAYEPLVANLVAAPTWIFFPVYALVLGPGSASKIAFAVTGAVLPITLAVIAGVSNTSTSLLSAGRAMGARGAMLLRVVVIPNAVPEIMTGLRIGLTLATLGIVAGEYLGGQAGLGYLIAAAGQSFHTPEVYAYVVLTLLLAIVLNAGMGLLTSLVRKERGIQ